MKEQISKIKKKYLDLKKNINDSTLIKDTKTLANLSQELYHIEKIYNIIIDYEKIKNQIQENLTLIKEEKDSGLSELAKEENQTLSNILKQKEEELKIKLLPGDPNDKKNVILEIRAGAGGDESSLFVQELFSAYCAYAQSKSWKVDVISISEGNVGGYKEVIASINGFMVYSTLKYESGVHRVQRVPKTESQGRIHTSTITVVVLPSADPVNVKINPSDLRIDVCRSSGAGGQHVNTTDSAVRITHLPTKITVYCQQEKSQHANKEKAFKILYARILDFQTDKKKKEESQKRQDQMGTGDRSQRIRTYNFPQSRLTDHRIPVTKKNLSNIMAGNFEDLFSSLRLYYQNLAFAKDK
ncbi:MAG: peptide chain release factor 1 [Bdellovibrionaceae bacterium]|nr:peptide chain release factor 1 [Pseudobdellovibrionaceae bacterium]